METHKKVKKHKGFLIFKGKSFLEKDQIFLKKSHISNMYMNLEVSTIKGIFKYLYFKRAICSFIKVITPRIKKR